MEVEHFRFFSVFLAAGLVDMSSESMKFLDASNAEKQMYLYPNKMASRPGQHLLRAKSNAEIFLLSALYSSFFICCLAALWPTFGCYRANSLTHPMLMTAFGSSVFGPELD